MKQRVDAVTAIRLDSVAIPALGQFLDDASVFLECGTWLHNSDGSIETVAGSFDDTDSFRVGACLVADVVSFVDVSVEAVVVECDVYVDNVAVLENALIGDTVTDGFVDAGTDGFGEVVVIERGWV